MTLSLKIFTTVLLIVVASLVPAIFTLVDQKQQGQHFWNRITTPGWLYLSAVIIGGIITIILTVLEHRDSNDEKAQLTDNLNEIKTAIKNSGMMYDSATKTILNFNQENVIGGIVTQGIRNNISNNQIGSFGFDIDSETLGNILKNIKEQERQYKVKGNKIHIRTVKNTIGFRTIPSIYKMLIENGYQLHGITEVQSNEIDIKKGGIGIGFSFPDKLIVVTLGELP